MMRLVASIDVDCPRMNTQILEHHQQMCSKNENNVKMFDAFMILDWRQANASNVDNIEHEGHTQLDNALLLYLVMSSVPAYAASNQHFVAENEYGNAKEDDGKIIHFSALIYIVVYFGSQSDEHLVKEWSFQRSHLLGDNGVVLSACLFIFHEELRFQK